MLTQTPPQHLSDFFSAFGSTTFVLKQSIVPVVAISPTESRMRCIGTAFIVSASGYFVTASHVILDPQESGYGKVERREGKTDLVGGASMGVVIPVNRATGIIGFQLIPIEQAWYWGMWEQSPLVHEPNRLNRLTDVAIGKLPPREDGTAYQALNLSLLPFSVGEGAFAIGYAEMQDVPVERVDGGLRFERFDHELYVSFGKITAIYPNNHVTRDIPTPGPSFEFEARIPGKMSGAPIFGAEGAIIRGVVSRSFQDERHASGCMVGPIMELPLNRNVSLRDMMRARSEGIAVVQGRGL